MRQRLRTVAVGALALLALCMAAPAAHAADATVEPPTTAAALPTFTCRLQANYSGPSHGIYYSGSANCSKATSEMEIDAALYKDGYDLKGATQYAHGTNRSSLSTPQGYCPRGNLGAQCQPGWYLVEVFFEIRAPGWNMIATSPEGTVNECTRPAGSSTYYCTASTWRSWA